MHYSTRLRHEVSRQIPSIKSSRSRLLLGTGAALAAMALFVQYRTRKSEQENPPAGKFIEVDGVRLHYLERGQGQPLVILHGNGSMSKEMDVSGLVDLAAENYRVIVFDRPGYGYSERPRTTLWNPMAQAKLLQRALQQLDVEQPLIVAHSWGTLVAIALALLQPDSVRSLLLLSGYYYPTARLDVPLLSPPALPIIGDLMRYTIAPVVGRLAWPAMVRKLFAPAETAPRFKQEYPVWMGLRPGPIRAAAEESAMMIPAAAQLSKRYHELTLPVTIMAGAADLQVFPKLHSQRLHRELPQSELILVPEVGHMIQHTVPQEVMTAIDRLACPQHLLAENHAGALYSSQQASAPH